MAKKTDAQAVEDEAQNSPLAKATEQGYIGVLPDPAPNEDYAVDGAITRGDKVDPAREDRLAEVEEENAKTLSTAAPASNWDKPKADDGA